MTVLSMVSSSAPSAVPTQQELQQASVDDAARFKEMLQGERSRFAAKKPGVMAADAGDTSSDSPPDTPARPVRRGPVAEASEAASDTVREVRDAVASVLPDVIVDALLPAQPMPTVVQPAAADADAAASAAASDPSTTPEPAVAVQAATTDPTTLMQAVAQGLQQAAPTVQATPTPQSTAQAAEKPSTTPVTTPRVMSSTGPDTPTGHGAPTPERGAAGQGDNQQRDPALFAQSAISGEPTPADPAAAAQATDKTSAPSATTLAPAVGGAQPATDTATQPTTTAHLEVAGRLRQAPAAEQVALHVTRLGEGGDRRITVTLDPPELGRVDITLETRAAGTTLVLAADRQETLDLLRRDQAMLDSALAKSNVKLDGSPEFSLRQNGEQAQGQRQRGDGGGLAEANEAEPIRPNESRAVLAGAIDIIV